MIAAALLRSHFLFFPSGRVPKKMEDAGGRLQEMVVVPGSEHHKWLSQDYGEDMAICHCYVLLEATHGQEGDVREHGDEHCYPPG